MMDLNRLDWEALQRAVGLVAEGVARHINGEYFEAYMASPLLLRIDIVCPSVSGPQWEPNSGDEGPYPTDQEVLTCQ